MEEQDLNSLIFIYAGIILVGALLGGLLPLFCTYCLRDKRILELVSLLGAGLLLGVGVVIIIPEGMSMLYKADPGSKLISGVLILSGFLLMLLIDEIFTLCKKDQKGLDPLHTPLLEEHKPNSDPEVVVKDKPKKIAGKLTTLSLTIHCVADGMALGFSEICKKC